MFFRHVRSWLAAGSVLTAAAGFAQADHCCSPCPPACPPATCKVRVVEYVPEQYPVTRTTYKVECREEAYTAYKTEWVSEQRPCTRTVWKSVCETVNETRSYCVQVPCVETRTCMKTVYSKQLVTEVKKVMVDRGCWTCVEVPARPTLRDRLRRMGRRDDCCCECPKTVTKKVWCPNWVCEDRCVTRCVTTCTQVPHTYTVTTCKTEWRQQVVPVTRYRCVPEQVTETVTVCTPRQVAVQCKRLVSHCVPCTETVMCCRMVPRCVEKEVPAQASCCEAAPCHYRARRAKVCCN